jgi:hypothetical protein
MPPDQLEHIKAVVALHCVEDRWTAAATTCIGGAHDMQAAHTCMRQHLTVEQHERLMHDFDASAPEKPVESALRVTSIEPALGDADGGTYVRISGAGFLLPTTRNVKVYFGTRQGTVVRFASDTELIVEAPGGKPGAPVDVLAIFEPGGETKLPGAFTFIEKDAAAPSPPPVGGQAAIAAKLNDEGKALMVKKQFTEASAKFRDAVARTPEAKYFLNLCISLYSEGKFGEALTACQAGTVNNPDAALMKKLAKAADDVKREAKRQNIDLAPY